ncbi:3' exoribonuclease family, domain 1 [Nitzschia inconspicua]|uniref:polyribonucleotide nucleotidyltransferase n=1 Tax=Nitzschia inconspicua TaxID=303405 RepID=A0A9K3LFX7_9STRA|nr:3' exoribonuclease family, domain 1 [Nitzschia inconspicua]
MSTAVYSKKPKLEFSVGRIANLTESSVVASSGQTVALVTMATSSPEMNMMNHDYNVVLKHFLKTKCQKESSSAMVPLMVEYRQRHHAVGKIPTSATRSDNRRMTNAEVLASRAIDRALRPLLQSPTNRNGSLLESQDEAVHLTCSIQACPISEDGSAGGHPVALALNAASVALKDRLQEPVAAVYLCLMQDGTVVEDSPRSFAMDINNGVIGELLYAGTRENVVMMEFSGYLDEARLVELISKAHELIQARIQTQQSTLSRLTSVTDESDEALRLALGLDSSVSATTEVVGTPKRMKEIMEIADVIYDEAFHYCKTQVGDAALRLFGVTSTNERQQSHTAVSVHSEKKSGVLPGKALRGRREHLIHEEIRRLLQGFLPTDVQLASVYQSLQEYDCSITNSLAEAIGSKILKESMQEAAVKYKCRADGRSTRIIRPIEAEVPALPEVVHGSALFTRGETQVLCTTTLGPPKDGILISDPYESSSLAVGQVPDDAPFNDLPVGSLRYLRNQEYLESDMNSRKVRASREQTGDSGTLRDRRRAFLQYDFPGYSKGEVKTGPGTSASRREIGHGALAEKSILPILPPPGEFPYTIRMTSEVTSSNGSSSMASVCGATLSLLDAGVPIKAPAAGVSIGLANNGSNELLVDLTGTEDHYGLMDFKIAGTEENVTAFQLDVKQPLPLSVVTEALELARQGRIEILKEMNVQSEKTSDGAVSGLRPRSELKPTAPRVEIVRFDPVRKKDLLGPGGVVIRQMEDRFNVSLDLTQEGQCLLFGDDRIMVKKAKAAVMDLVSDVEVGVTYEGTVIELRDFGAIIELLRNKEGLCHVSELATKEEIRNHPSGSLGLVNQLLQVGQKFDVVCTAVDVIQGTIRVRPASKKK